MRLRSYGIFRALAYAARSIEKKPYEQWLWEYGTDTGVCAAIKGSEFREKASGEAPSRSPLENLEKYR